MTQTLAHVVFLPEMPFFLLMEISLFLLQILDKIDFFETSQTNPKPSEYFLSPKLFDSHLHYSFVVVVT